MRYLEITYPDVNNGLGCRVTLWVAGCRHHCKGCQNCFSWDFNAGKEFTEETKENLYKILSLSYIKGITFSGGDPLDSSEDVIALARMIKQDFPDKDIWLYSGYELDEIQADDEKRPILEYIDYLVDGEFKIALKDTSLAFRGSSNQNIWHKSNNKFQIINLD